MKEDEIKIKDNKKDQLIKFLPARYIGLSEDK